LKHHFVDSMFYLDRTDLTLYIFS